MSSLVHTLRKLDNSGVKYCILRNYQFVRGDDPGSDVDIVIQKSDRAEASRILENNGFYETNKSGLTRSFHKGYVNKEVVTIDISWDQPQYKGIPTVDGDRLLADRRNLNDCWIPSKEDYFVHLVFHGAIKKGYYKDSYKENIKRYGQQVDRDRVNQHATELFGSKGSQAIEFALDGNFEAIHNMRRELVIAHYLKQPLSLCGFFSLPLHQFSLTDVFFEGVKQIKPSPPPIVAVTGPDGSGKSTLTQNAVREFESMGYDVDLIKLGLTNDSTILMETAKFLYNRLSGYEVEKVKEAERKGVKTLGSRDGLHKALIHYLDISIRWIQARNSDADVVISDRYIHDVGIYDRPGPLARTFIWFESDNVYLFLLTGDPDILVERSEYTHESIEELVERYESLDFKRLDATDNPETVVDNLFECVFRETDILRYL